MNNAEKFQEVFGYYATEMWAKSESEFLEWINSNYTPTIEVDEDCISRTYLEEQLQQIEDITAMAHIDLGEDPYDETDKITMPISTVRKIFKNAPSVVPTARENRTTAEPQTYITEDRDTQILDAWQVHHRNTTNAVEDCISREYLLSKVYDMDNDNLVVDLKDIEDAPNVLPKRSCYRCGLREDCADSTVLTAERT